MHVQAEEVLDPVVGVGPRRRGRAGDRQRSAGGRGYTLPLDNVYGLPPATATKAISDGTAVIVQPLPVGQHQIVVHLEAPALGGTVEIVYNLTVVTRLD